MRVECQDYHCRRCQPTIISQHNMEQMVESLQQVFLTNCPHLWNHPRVFEGIVKSDHLAVAITPRVAVEPEGK